MDSIAKYPANVLTRAKWNATKRNVDRYGRINSQTREPLRLAPREKEVARPIQICLFCLHIVLQSLDMASALGKLTFFSLACRSDGIKYRPGQNWTKEILYYGQQCTVPCSCVRRGKSVCNMSVCMTRIPLENDQPGQKG
jgi:hypothetical protein